jgi:hypothetical protein
MNTAEIPAQDFFIAEGQELYTLYQWSCRRNRGNEGKKDFVQQNIL